MLVNMRVLGLVTIAGMMTMFSAGYFIGVVIGFIIFGGVLYMCHQEDRRRERKGKQV
ncbi:hypothetical protein [Klebsiella phage phiKp_4]|nr:hypothetical protein [Klebsiella phage phiKp_1]BEH83876.1 hypothetical protein [Klebsiella phage phiKp_3]BEH83997.1 hypothetical protein [Klebsiella phage phiKp_4]BEH84274.1 hypothetical protein [Klebsiella phage phiKp_5]BEH84731.1 hypothetical protein [Klebsiella phage phiKp_8]BEH85422.1 hypothetical protein [Klebsiella phage phiKp_10]BEH85536.1 hypothetical protein [Klebsiella phage phiKp_11]BEH85848.1 hypothetical protein [Klebsiella phage phiKp_12]BEH86033.1 hypothetical protein [Kle